ncbi:PhoX family protein [Inhella gelatinilytica]|uniref:PhoX family phosphatase n=1 Tax=Inhella gelatinilytica TaxID=2795030 RepID=A0A931NE28_9BURK|nr:PhoX family phosphatase [Inhella gelatinilytica]MBH9553727.1 PhoX family phosphatase [Inhella gelatinilytica]
MNDRLCLDRPDFNDEDSNRSDNPHFDQVLTARLSRRSLLRSGVGASSAALGGVLLSACDSEAAPAPAPLPAPAPAPAPSPLVTSLGFAAVAKSLDDKVTVPTGYSVSILYALGDPLRAATTDFKNDGTDIDWENRAGDHHDGMDWFGLSSSGTPSTTAVDRGLLAINHEATTDETRASFFIHANGGTATLPRPGAEVDKELAIHGISVVEVRKTAGSWAYQKDSPFNFRIHQSTEVELAGPVRGSLQVITKFSPTGTSTRGTLNNCGAGKTPWGTYVSGEENWAGYFFRAGNDDSVRGDKSVTALKRYGRAAGAASRHGWETGGADDRYLRWNISKSGVSTDGSDDYRNEMNAQGYILEVDPYTKTRKAVKRTALGRFAHESAAFGKPVVGQPIAAYMGDDSRNEYIYKYVSTALWAEADATAADRLAVGAKYLDQGKLFVAKFNADGTGQWAELSLLNPMVRDYTGYTFTDQADLCVNTRLAADAVGATKMDRPEWCSVNPKNGEIYFTLTNNSNRRAEPAAGGSQLAPDSANPRAYTDIKNASSSQIGNPNGHILRIKEDTGGAAATAFTWDVYLFAAEASAAPGLVNLSNLTADQDMSSPDGLAFSPATGICWIQTDDGAYTDVTNCMMLAALPGQVGDGAKKTLSYSRSTGGALTVDTFVGKTPAATELKRFLVGPRDCEITGICETPDGKALFINIQHPGEGTAMANIADPTKYSSQWPSNAGYGAGKRPRSATIVITKTDGDVIGR